MTASQAKVAAFLNLESGEERPVALLAGLYFFLALSFVFIQSITFGLFIAEFGTQNLPIAYLTIAIMASLVAFIYLKLSDRLPFTRLLYTNLVFITLMCLLYWVGLTSPMSRGFTFFLPFWFQTMINLANLAVWPLAGRIFDLRQAKRIFAIIGTGNWLAVIAGGFIIAPLVRLVGPPNLMLLAAVAALAALFVLFAIIRLSISRLQPVQDSRPNPEPVKTTPPVSPLKDPFIRLIFAYFLLWWVSFYFVDNIFYDRAAFQFPDPGLLAGYIGKLLSATGIVALVTTTFLTSRIITRFGLRAGLILMPLGVVIIIALVAGIGTLFPASIILLWLVTLAKLINVALGFSISQSASTLLYQPLPAEQRGRTQTIAEGIVQPLAIGIAGLALLLFNTILGMKAVQLSYVFLVIAVAWVAVILLLSRQYPLVLVKTLTRRRLGETPPDLNDPASLQVLQQALGSRHPSDVLFALNRLEQVDLPTYRSTLRETYTKLLAHPVPEIRKDVILRAQQLGLKEVAHNIRDWIETESVTEVRAAALNALLVLYGDQAFEQVAAALQDADPNIRRAALVALMQHGGIDGVMAAGHTFNLLYQSSDPADRVLAAKVIAEVGLSHYHEPLLHLLEDGQAEVRQAALKAAGEVRSPHLWEAVVAACADPETSRIASQALVRGGSTALPAIESAIRAESLSNRHLSSLSRALGAIGGERAVSLLESLISHPDNSVRARVFMALSNCRYRLADTDDLFDSLLQLEVQQAARWSALLRTLLEIEPPNLLADALAQSILQARERLLLLLSFAYDPKTILNVRDALSRGTANQHAYALELIDTRLPSRLKGLVLPLFEELPPKTRVERWRAAGVPIPEMSRSEWLASLISSQDAIHVSPWLRACALYISGSNGQTGQTQAHGTDRLSTETPTGLQVQEGLQPMLLTIEKVLALKKVSVFSQVPDEVLADVATFLDEQEFPENETIFSKGDYGDSLYVIVNGQVRIHDGNRLLQMLGEGEVFGEMALLDPEKRSASAAAVGTTRLLRLGQSALFELLGEHPEVATGIIRVLTRRLRDRMVDISELDAQMKQLQAIQPV